MDGKNVHSQMENIIQQGAQVLEIDLSKLPSGVYLINLGSVTKCISQKFIKN